MYSFHSILPSLTIYMLGVKELLTNTQKASIWEDQCRERSVASKILENKQELLLLQVKPLVGLNQAAKIVGIS